VKTAFQGRERALISDASCATPVGFIACVIESATDLNSSAQSVFLPGKCKTSATRPVPGDGTRAPRRRSASRCQSRKRFVAAVSGELLKLGFDRRFISH